MLRLCFFFLLSCFALLFLRKFLSPTFISFWSAIFLFFFLQPFSPGELGTASQKKKWRQLCTLCPFLPPKPPFAAAQGEKREGKLYSHPTRPLSNCWLRWAYCLSCSGYCHCTWARSVFLSWVCLSMLRLLKYCMAMRARRSAHLFYHESPTWYQHAVFEILLQIG